MSAKSRERRENRKLDAVFKRATLFDYFISCDLPPFENDGRQVPVFNIQSVVDAQDGKKVEIVEPIRLPFDAMFMEMLWSKKIPIGILLNAIDEDYPDYSKWAKHLEDKTPNLIVGNIFLPDFKHAGFDAVYNFACSLDEDFRLLESVQYFIPLKGAPDAINADISVTCRGTMGFIFFALELMNARNIEFVEHEPSAEDNAIYQRRYGVPLIKYKTLAIKPTGKRYEGDKPQQQFDVMPSHLRRGNFAHYTDDAPLFGKYTGTFWRPATVVGSEKNGIVVKDYKVQTSAEVQS